MAALQWMNKDLIKGNPVSAMGDPTIFFLIAKKDGAGHTTGRIMRFRKRK
jgi:hypothetical protein